MTSDAAAPQFRRGQQGHACGLISGTGLLTPASAAGTRCDRRRLPAAARPRGADARHATARLWLLPTPEFRRTAFDSRGALWEIARKTGDPERALSNLLERDRMFTDCLRRDLKRLGLPAIEISTGMTEDDLAERVTEALGL